MKRTRKDLVQFLEKESFRNNNQFADKLIQEKWVEVEDSLECWVITYYDKNHIRTAHKTREEAIDFAKTSGCGFMITKVREVIEDSND